MNRRGFFAAVAGLIGVGALPAVAGQRIYRGATVVCGGGGGGPAPGVFVESADTAALRAQRHKFLDELESSGLLQVVSDTGANI